jgi:thimet oligopeptidase
MLHDYTAITADGITVITEDAITQAEHLIDGIISVDGARTYLDTLAPLNRVQVLITDAYGTGAFLGRVHPDEDVRNAAIATEERLQKWQNDLVFRRDLYEAVHAFAATAEAAALEGEEARLLEHVQRDFRRVGHELPDESRAELQRLRNRLTELQVAFEKNLAEYKDAIIVTREDLDGLTESYISRLESGDEEGTYKVSLDYPDYIPFMQEAKRRDLRYELQHKYLNTAAAENRPLLEEAIVIRDRMAGLLGFESWAHYSTEVKMAKNPDNVQQLYSDLIPGLQAIAADEIEVMQRLLDQDHPGETLQLWDWVYYDTELRKHEFGVDPNEVARYFPLEPTFDGMFEVLGELFGLEFRRVTDTKAWHEDVFLYEIVDTDSGEVIARFYADLFPRKGKYTHAAAFGLSYGHETADGYHQPVAAIVANFTKPSATEPSLLQHSEVVTLWHEFGHILHFTITKARLPRFSGYETEWDFVEVPSQILENWVWDADVLKRFAKHYETGEPIPEKLVDQLVAARDLNEAFKALRQIYMGKMDMAFHAPGTDKDLDALAREAYAIALLPYHEETFMPSGFGHIMGGYDAGYYSYLWSKVYSDDLFSVFRDEGIMNPDTGRRYRREVLETGGSRDGGDMLRAFLGREPSKDAFLEMIGLKE